MCFDVLGPTLSGCARKRGRKQKERAEEMGSYEYGRGRKKKERKDNEGANFACTTIGKRESKGERRLHTEQARYTTRGGRRKGSLERGQSVSTAGDLRTRTDQRFRL